MKKSTTQLLDLLKSTKNLDKYFEENAEEFTELKPYELLNEIIKNKNINKTELIKKTCIERNYAYQILSGTKTPSRDKLLMFCFGLEMSIDEIQHFLLKCSAPQLYAKNKRDNVILFALENKLTITEMNGMLFELGLDIFE